jgi:DNA-binding NarL/FixJ family response regulator
MSARESSLLIIAHNPLLRGGITDLLNEQPDLTAVGVCPEWARVQQAVVETRPDLILLDSCLGAQYSRRLLELAQEINARSRVIVMDLLGTPEEVIEFVEAGCSGLILKDTTIEHFVGTIRAVARGGSVLPSSLTETIFSFVARRAAGWGTETVREAVMLTRRERDVMALIAEGLSNKEIATRLGIAVHTVKSHVHLILEKLALHTRLEIAAFALRKPE